PAPEHWRAGQTGNEPIGDQTMNSQHFFYPSLAALAAAWCAHAAEPTSGESPADHLPAHISQVTVSVPTGRTTERGFYFCRRHLATRWKSTSPRHGCAA